MVETKFIRTNSQCKLMLFWILTIILGLYSSFSFLIPHYQQAFQRYLCHSWHYSFNVNSAVSTLLSAFGIFIALCKETQEPRQTLTDLRGPLRTLIDPTVTISSDSQTIPGAKVAPGGRKNCLLIKLYSVYRVFDSLKLHLNLLCLLHLQTLLQHHLLCLLCEVFGPCCCPACGCCWL